MILYEFEGKDLLSKNGVFVPKSQLIKSPADFVNLNFPLILKAQVLSGKRKVAGGILEALDKSELLNKSKLIFSKLINGEEVKSILVEEKVDFKNEYYISISYDTDFRSPVITFSGQGGTGIEERRAKIIPVNPITKEFKKDGLPENVLSLLEKLISVFLDNDLLLLEINPLVESKAGELIALDAKIKLDDEAKSKHPDWNYPTRGVAGHKPTKNELAAKKIDEGDYRGTAGSAYFDLPGDIAVLASGGGASLAGMDALIKAGGKPANYTEYSSDPTREKVRKLANIVLSKKGLHGIWVGGAVANFTDIYETLSGVLDALKETKIDPKMPIVIRRGGPRDKEAFEMLSKEKGFNFHLFGPEKSITESAKIIVDLAQKYALTS